MIKKVIILLFSTLVGENLLAADVVLNIEEEEALPRFNLPEIWIEVFAEASKSSANSKNEDFWNHIGRLRNCLGEKEKIGRADVDVALANHLALPPLRKLVLDYWHGEGQWNKVALAELPKPSDRKRAFRSPFRAPALFYCRVNNAALAYVMHEITSDNEQDFVDAIREIIENISAHFNSNSSYVSYLKTIPDLCQNKEYDKMETCILTAQAKRLPYVIDDLKPTHLPKSVATQFFTPTEIIELASKEMPLIGAEERTFRRDVNKSRHIVRAVGGFALAVMIVGDYFLMKTCPHRNGGGCVADLVLSNFSFGTLALLGTCILWGHLYSNEIQKFVRTRSL